MVEVYPTTRVLIEFPKDTLRKFLFIQMGRDRSLYVGFGMKPRREVKKGSAQPGATVSWTEGEVVPGIPKALKVSFHNSGQVHFTRVYESDLKQYDVVAAHGGPKLTQIDRACYLFRVISTDPASFDVYTRPLTAYDAVVPAWTVGKPFIVTAILGQSPVQLIDPLNAGFAFAVFDGPFNTVLSLNFNFYDMDWPPATYLVVSSSIQFVGPQDVPWRFS